MITFKQFLQERDDKVKATNKIFAISIDDGEQALADKSSDALRAAKTQVLYRGHPHPPGDFFEFDGEKSKRNPTQMNGSVVADIMEQFPNWKDYPLRSRAIICSTDKHYAANYGGGKVVAMMPHNGVRIAVCPTSDMKNAFAAGWSKSVSGQEPSVTDLGKWIGTAIQEQFGAYEEAKLISRLKNITVGSLRVAKAKKKASGSTAIPFDRLTKALQDTQFNNLYDALVYLLDPKRNKFSIMSNVADIPDQREAWFSDKAVAVRCTKGTSPLPSTVAGLCAEYKIDSEKFRM